VYELGVPLPGWTLPGFVTTGAAQSLLRAHGVVPGRRVVVAGNGPLNFQLAADLVNAGVNLAAVVEASRPSAQWTSLARAASAAPGLIGQGVGYLARLRRARVPIHYGSVIVAAHGAPRVEGCTVAPIDASGRPDARAATRFDVDTVCVGYGFLPANEIARGLGCRHSVDSRGQLATIVDADGLTTVPGVYAVGDAVALRGAQRRAVTDSSRDARWRDRSGWSFRRAYRASSRVPARAGAALVVPARALAGVLGTRDAHAARAARHDRVPLRERHMRAVEDAIGRGAVTSAP
jgi:hypothetical protein